MRASVIASYSSFSVVEVPDVAAAAMADVAARHGYEAILLDEKIHTPSQRVVDPRDPVSPTSPATFGDGLFVLQYRAFASPVWRDAVARLGLVEIERLPERAVVVAGSHEAFLAASDLPFVQFAHRFDVSWKAAPVASLMEKGQYTIQFADTPQAASNIEDLRTIAGGFQHEVQYLTYHNIRVELNGAQLAKVVDLPYVLSVERFVPPAPSEERQAHAIKGIAAPDGTSYVTWLAARGITPAELTASNILVDVVDLGLDRGCGLFPQHPDLAGREAYWHVYTNEPTPTTPPNSPPFPANGADRANHGTMVAGIIGGNGTEASQVDGAYRYGLGIAPGLRVGSTKIFEKDFKVAATGDIFTWARAAVTARCGEPCAPSTPCPASIQNHSYNDYSNDGSTFGIYNMTSQQYDTVVRDADNVTPGDQPLAMAVATGNYRQRQTLANRVLPAATAKNVLSMGGVENVRPRVTSCGTTGLDALRNSSEGFYRMSYQSLRTTVDFRYKPELVAPSTVIYSTRSQDPVALPYCAVAGPFFTGASGTSFAAPYGAAAMALVKFHRRKFYYHDPSPAMLKAMLVAGARSLTGSPDRHDGLEYDGTPSNFRVDRWPGYEQGFGLLQLNTLFDTSTYHWWLDQSYVLNLSSQTSYTRNFVINDGTRPTRIVLAWTDVPAAVNAPMSYVNKLQLQAQFGSCSTRYFGNSTDAQDNSYLHDCRTRPATIGGPSDVVSIISIPAGRYPSGTVFTAIVSASLTGTARRDLAGPNQDFALFMMNARPQ